MYRVILALFLGLNVGALLANFHNEDIVDDPETFD